MSAPIEPVSTSPHRIVLVDARDDRRQMMHRVVEGDDARALLVGEADSEASALAVVDEQQADVVVIEVNMPTAAGLATIAALRRRYPQLGIVGCSFDVDRATAALVVAEGADLFLAKPVTRGDLLAAIDGLAVRVGPEDQRAEALQAGPG